MDIRQSVQYSIKSLQLVTRVGTSDLIQVYEEINLFGNLMLPCMSGNIVIRDAVGLIRELRLNGNETLYMRIKKTDEFDGLDFEKKFRVYKITQRRLVNQTSEVFILHFASEEFMLSEQQKLNQSFKGTYSAAVKTILEKYLRLPFESQTKGGSSFYSVIDETKGLNKFVLPNLTPFDSIDWISKRALNKNNLPDFVFYERSDIGYWFISLSKLMNFGAQFKIFFDTKNIDKNVGREILGARDYKILSQFDSVEKIRSGTYAGKFISIDPVTRQYDTKIQTPFEDTYDQSEHPNRYMLYDGFTTNKLGKTFNSMYDSKVVLYPSGDSRRESNYIKQNDANTSNFIENTTDYILQRKSIFTNLLQRKIRITLPGNFSLQPGLMVFLDMPKRSITTPGDDQYDESLRGEYIVLAVRHIIQYDKHETIIDVATDSSRLAY